MQFIDQANIILKAGKGGNGIVSFRREKFVPAGGPSGGNGGKGGSIILIADNNLQTLLDFKFNREIFAKDGFKGGPNKRTGASGENTILKVPCGTEVRDVNSGIILGDLTQDKQSLTIAYGGRGGHGNAYYLSNQNRAPESFTEGKEGEIWEVQLELKLLAEVGIIGLGVIVLLTAFKGVTEEHDLGPAFNEALPFTALLVVFFCIVGVIHDQNLFDPIIVYVLAQSTDIQAPLFFVANAFA